jgi:hypothetical protein
LYCSEALCDEKNQSKLANVWSMKGLKGGKYKKTPKTSPPQKCSTWHFKWPEYKLLIVFIFKFCFHYKMTITGYFHYISQLFFHKFCKKRHISFLGHKARKFVLIKCFHSKRKLCYKDHILAALNHWQFYYTLLYNQISGSLQINTKI